MAYNQQYAYGPSQGYGQTHPQQRRQGPPRGPPPGRYNNNNNNNYNEHQQYAQDGYYDDGYDYSPAYHGQRPPPQDRNGYGPRPPNSRPGPRQDNRMRGPPPGQYNRRDDFQQGDRGEQWQGIQSWQEEHDQYGYPQNGRPPPRQGQPNRPYQDSRPPPRGYPDQRQHDYHGYDSGPRRNDYDDERRPPNDYPERWQSAQPQDQRRLDYPHDAGRNPPRDYANNSFEEYDGPLERPPQVFGDRRRPSHSNSDMGPARGPQDIYQQPQYAQSHDGAVSEDTQSRGQRARPPPIEVTSDNPYAPQSASRRPLIEPLSPVDLPQDNAFPLFPTTKVKAGNGDKPAESNAEPPSRVQNFSKAHLAEPPLQSPTIRLEPPSPVRVPAGADSTPNGISQRSAQLPSSYSDGQLPAQRSYDNNDGQLPTSRSQNFLGNSPQDRFDDRRTPAKDIRFNGSEQTLPYRTRPDNGPQPQQATRSSYEEVRTPTTQTRFGGPGPVIPDNANGSSRNPYEDEQGPLPPPPQGRFDEPAPQSPRRADYGALSNPSQQGVAAPRPNGKGHQRVSSQSEILANGYINDIGSISRTPEPLSSRDAQIEAEMPNFANMENQPYNPYQPRQESSQQLNKPPPPPDASYQNAGGAMAASNMRPPPSRCPPSGSNFGPHPANQPPKPYYQDAYQQRPSTAGAVPGPVGPGGPLGAPLSAPLQGYGPRPVPHRPGTAGDPVRPGINGGAAPALQNASPSGRAPSAPPAQSQAMGTPLSKAVSNPDALPAHPAPVRPGLTNGGSSGQAQSRSASGAPPADTRRTSASAPVTQAEINRLQALVNAHPQDSATALLLAKKLVEASNVLASENGRLDARATAKNRERYVLDAHRRVKKLVSAGYPDAMFYLADCYGQGLLGLPDDPKEAFNLYQAAAKAGHGQAAYRTAMCCEIGPEEGGGTRKDPQKAVQWYRRAAQLQDVSAMYKLGVICLRGLLAEPKNVVEAERWLKRAAEKADKENPHALHELAAMHEPDNPDRDVRAKIIPDEKYARELFFQAANFGYMKSQFKLGQAYEYGGLGLPVDARNSIAWYSKAAAQGEHQAELALSGWYLTGAEGILPNSDQEAYLWARKAAMADPPLAKAMFAMGYYTETGIGCQSSLDEAKKWYARAAACKFPKAIDRLEELKRGGSRKDGTVVRREVKQQVR